MKSWNAPATLNAFTGGSAEVTSVYLDIKDQFEILLKTSILTKHLDAHMKPSAPLLRR